MFMTIGYKAERIKLWIAKFPFLAPYIDMSEEALSHTNDPDALCRGLVKDYCVCTWITDKYGRKTSMATASSNMFSHTDIYVESRDGRMLAVDTKYPSWLSKDSVMWFEPLKNEASKADKLFYIRADGYAWVLDRRGCLEELKSKPRYQRSDVLCNFNWSDISDKFKAEIDMVGAFDIIKGKLYV